MQPKEVKPALLTKTEVQWLLGNKQVSKSHEYFMKSNIKSKLQTFSELELPLLIEKGFLQTSLERAKCLTGLHHRSPELVKFALHKNVTLEENP